MLIDGARVVVVASGFLVTESADPIALYSDGKTTTTAIKDFAITTVSSNEYETLVTRPGINTPSNAVPHCETTATGPVATCRQHPLSRR
jgi:hypothetical protein